MLFRSEVVTSSMASSFIANEVSVTLSVDASATATQSAYEVACGVLDDFSVALENKFSTEMEQLGIRSIVYDQNKGIKIVPIYRSATLCAVAAEKLPIDENTIWSVV